MPSVPLVAHPASGLRVAHPTLCAGIEKWGVVERDGVKVYAYELDGLGNMLVRAGQEWSWHM